MTTVGKGNYYGIEPERDVLEAGRKALGLSKRYVRKHFNDSTDFEGRDFGVSFDMVLMQSILTHCTPRMVARALGKAKEVLADDGVILATVYLNLRVPMRFDYLWVYPVTIPIHPDWLKNQFKGMGLAGEQLEYEHPNGQTWYAIRKIPGWQKPKS